MLTAARIRGTSPTSTCSDGETCSAAAAFRTSVSHMLTEQRAARRLELDACGHRRREYFADGCPVLLLQTFTQMKGGTESNMSGGKCGP